MHSGLPGSGYEVKYVFLALRHVNPGLVQVRTGPTTLLPLDDPELEQLLPLLLDPLDAPELFAVPASVFDDPLEKPEPSDDPELVADIPLSCDAEPLDEPPLEPLDELDPAYEPELLDDRSLLPELADDAGAGVSEAHPASLATTEITPSVIAKGRLRGITPHLKATDGRDHVRALAKHDRPPRNAQHDPAEALEIATQQSAAGTDKYAQAVLFW
jgi:hypothetical protein